MSYVIVDRATKTRTIIHSPSQFELTTAHGEAAVRQLSGGSGEGPVSLIYLDGRHAAAALPLAKWARSRGIPIILDAERPRGVDFDALIRTSFMRSCSALALVLTRL